LRVHAVAAADYPDAAAHRLGLALHIVAIDGDPARAQLPRAGEQAQ